MRWLGLGLAGAIGCGAAEGEDCGRDVACSDGLTCVSTVLCTVGPCPGTCRAGCDEDEDCETPQICATPWGWDEDGDRFCLDEDRQR
jgi:hypothetical protein